MSRYHRLGSLPKKRHTQFKKSDGSLYAEQLISSEGFSSDYTLAYHHHAPTQVLRRETAYSVKPNFVEHEDLVMRGFKGFSLNPKNDYLESRTILMGNDDLYIALAAPKKSMTEYFFKNSQADEMIFIHKGSGVLKTMLGNIPFSNGDHLIIPKGITYQFHFDTEENRLFIVESFSALRFPKKYLNRSGQLLEHAPFYERDIRLPEALEPQDETGEFEVRIKLGDKIYPYFYKSHPFDVVGWDGYHYPYALSIHDFEPITGRIHQPPPVHQTWEGNNFVTCAFVPRLYDYHPDAIPAPYNHSNIDSDEVLYYVDGDFMSRNNVEKGQLSLHPLGLTHGPHPGAVERSIGKKSTGELALMVDTFRPLKLTKEALNVEIEDYYKSWIH